MNGIISVVGEVDVAVLERVAAIMKTVITDVEVNLNDEIVWVEDSDCIRDEADLDKLVELIDKAENNPELGVYTQFIRMSENGDGEEEYNNIDYYYVAGKMAKIATGWRSMEDINQEFLNAPCDTTLEFTFDNNSECMTKIDEILREAINDVSFEVSNHFVIEHTFALTFDGGVENLARSLARISPDMKFLINITYGCDDENEDLVQFGVIDCDNGQMFMSLTGCFEQNNPDWPEEDKEFMEPVEIKF